MRGSKRRAETLISEPEMEDAEKNVDERNGFFACYLLCSLCPRYKGHTYIGFTVNPRRRIRQHNGEIKCGAWRTKSKRPWEMVLCIHGFPSKVSALQFEWAWQHPRESKAVREAALSFKSLSGLANKIKLAYTMLTLPQWDRFNLSVNFFSSKYTTHSAHCPRLPKHMKTTVLPMAELPCYSNSSILDDDDDEDDDLVLQEQEIHDTHELISPIHPQIWESGEVEPTWMKSHHDSYQEEQDDDLRRQGYHVDGHTSQSQHEEEPSWMKVHDSGKEPSWIEVYDDRYELGNDHRDHDLQEIYVNRDISLSHTKNSELDGEPARFKVQDDDGHVHDFLGEKDHDGPTNVSPNKETPSTVIDGRSKLYHNHDIHERTSLNDPEFIESDEEKEHTPVHDIQSSTSLMHQSHGIDEKEEDDIYASISPCALKTSESKGLAFTKRFNSGEASMTSCSRGASLLDVIDLSTPLNWKAVCKRRKSMASICIEVVDLTESPA